MLKRLFTSNARIKLLQTFLANPEEEFFIRELTRKLSEQINSIRRELDNLKKMGLLRSKTKNRKKYYCVNKDFIFYEELKSIFAKAFSTNQNIATDLKKMGEVKLLVLTGQFMGLPTETVDMLIVGNLDKNALAEYISNEISTKRPVKFTIMTESDYKYRMDCKDKFIMDITHGEDSQILIKKL